MNTAARLPSPVAPSLCSKPALNSIPFIDLRPTVRRVEQAVLSDWAESLARGHFVGGPAVERLEVALAEHTQARHVVTCANGTDALLLALQALGCVAGDLVCMPNLTFWATYEAPAQLGCQVILLDIDETLQMNIDQLRAVIAARPVKACVVAHLFGWATPHLHAMRALCEDAGVALVEDAAQAFGVRVDGIPVLRDARIATTSFYPTKVLGGAMDGGAVFCRDEVLARAVRSLANHGRVAHHEHDRVGWNSRLSDLQAAYLLRMLEVFDTLIAERRSLFAAYARQLDGVPGLTFHRPPATVAGNAYLTMVTVAGMPGDTITDALATRGVGCARIYARTIDRQQPVSVAAGNPALSCSHAISEAVFSLPLYPGMPGDHIDLVVSHLKEVLANSRTEGGA